MREELSFPWDKKKLPLLIITIILPDKSYEMPPASKRIIAGNLFKFCRRTSTEFRVDISDYNLFIIFIVELQDNDKYSYNSSWKVVPQNMV